MSATTPQGAGHRHAGVRKAVILVAGLGTRLLPAAKSQPKEMLPVGRKPCVQYVVEEMIQAGIKQILFITGRKKTSIEDYFDADPELERRLMDSGQMGMVEEISWLNNSDVTFFYTRQAFQRGQADAIRLAEEFVGSEPFVVAFGDTIIRSSGRANLVQRLVAAHQSSGTTCAFAVEPVNPEDVYRYGVVVPAAGSDLAAFDITGLVEKPDRASAPSNLAIVPRYVFDASLFDAIRLTLPGKNGEVWLADSIGILLKQGLRVRCVRLLSEETRYDIGNFETYFKAFVDLALADEKYGYTLRQHITKLSSEL